MKSIILISILVVFISGCKPVGAEANSLLIEEFNLSQLKLAISSNDVSKVVSQLNLAKQEQFKNDVNEYIMTLWSQSATDELDILKDELVLINIADFLSQAYRNKFVKVLPRSVLGVARTSIKSSNRKVVSRSLAILSRSSNEQDLEMIINMVQETESEYLFDSAVMSIIAMCEPNITKKLTESSRLSESRKKFITSSTLEFEEAGLCAYKGGS